MKKVIIASLFMIIYLMSYAGLVVEDISEGKKTISYIQNNMLRLAEEDTNMIIDVKNNRLVFYNMKDQKFWKGTPTQYIDLLEKTIKRAEAKSKERLETMSEEYKDLYEKMINKTYESILTKIKDTKENNIEKSKNILVEETKLKGNIAGHPATKYKVLVDGIHVRDVWASETIKFKKEIEIDKLSKMVRVFSVTDEEEEINEFDIYKEFYNKGYPMKIVEISSVDKELDIMVKKYEMMGQKPSPEQLVVFKQMLETTVEDKIVSFVQDIKEEKVGKAFFEVPKEYTKYEANEMFESLFNENNEDEE